MYCIKLNAFKIIYKYFFYNFFIETKRLICKNGFGG